MDVQYSWITCLGQLDRVFSVRKSSADLQVTEEALKRAGLKEKYDKLRDQFGDMVMIP